jgi:hypothetical protein
MSSGGSVTRWVTAIKDGDAAAQPLWERYHRRLVALTLVRRLPTLPGASRLPQG